MKTKKVYMWQFEWWCLDENAIHGKFLCIFPFNDCHGEEEFVSAIITSRSTRKKMQICYAIMLKWSDVSQTTRWFIAMRRVSSQGFFPHQMTFLLVWWFFSMSKKNA